MVDRDENWKVGAVIEEKFSDGKIFESDTDLLELADGIKRSLKELLETNKTLDIVVNAFTTSVKFAQEKTDLVLSDSDFITNMSTHTRRVVSEELKRNQEELNLC